MIPAVLQDCPQWVMWRFAERVDAQTGELHRTKVPYHAGSNQLAKSTDPATWVPFATAIVGAARYGADGIGFVLQAADPFVGVDLDHCYDPATGAIEYTARRIVSDLYSYTEITPSGTGLRVFCFGTLPPGGRKRGNVELYHSGRFLTVTGQRLPWTPRTLAERTTELAVIHARIWPLVPAPAAPVSTSPLLSDSAILDMARRASNSAKFTALWAGDTHGYHSRSEAHAALLAILGFYSQDRAQLERLFSQSGLCPHEKWTRADYRNRTIDLALRGGRERYQGAAR